MLEYPGTFIVLFPIALSRELCQEMIDKFDKDTRQFKGKITLGTQYGYDKPKMAANPLIKVTSDIAISGTKGWDEIDILVYSALMQPMREYRALYPDELNPGCPLDDSGYLMGRYEPNVGYFKPHVDESGAGTNRVLSAIFYLNNVEEGGETVFRHQKVEVKPVAGSLILFPPGWTHMHEAKTPVSGPKYIVTTFFTPKKGSLKADG